jgi:hypothetical protein
MPRVRSVLRHLDPAELADTTRQESRSRQRHLPPVSVYRWWARRTETVSGALIDAVNADQPGRLLIADMLPHDREEYRQQMGHVWLGFSEEQLRRLLAAAGFDRTRIVALPAHTEAKGPALFVASAVRG